MPRPTLYDHPKFHRLVYVLQIPEPQALGLLEYMWRVAYASGNAVIGDELDVEIAAKWWGERGVFCRAVVSVGLLDALDDGKFAVHDLEHHAPAYVRDRRRKELKRRETHHVVRGSSAELRGRVEECPPTPTPAPAPTHKENTVSVTGPAKRRTKVADQLPGFDAFWAAYPRKVGKGNAERAWAAIAPDELLARRITRAVSDHIAAWRDRGTEPEYIPHPATWLNARRWEDELTTTTTGAPTHDAMGRKILG